MKVSELHVVRAPEMTLVQVSELQGAPTPCVHRGTLRLPGLAAHHHPQPLPGPQPLPVPGPSTQPWKRATLGTHEAACISIRSHVAFRTPGELRKKNILT